MNEVSYYQEVSRNLSKIKMRRFTIEETQLFLDLYEREECLWRLDIDRSYRMESKRKEARDRIAEAMFIDGMDEECVRKKFLSLRQTFSQEMTKISKSKESGDRVYKSNIFWLSQMQRLLPGGIKRIKTTEYPSFTEEEEDMDNISIYSVTIKSEPDSLYGDNDQEIVNCPVPEKRIKEESNGLDNHELVEVDCTENPKQSTSSNNELDLFGKYIAAELKTLKPRTRVQLQKEIINMIFDEKIKEIF